MKIFFDTEFTGLHQNTTLISIGCVAEDGQEFYAEFTDYDWLQVDDWIADNVVAHLQLRDGVNVQANDKSVSVKGSREFIRKHLEMWLQEQATKNAVYGDMRNVFPDRHPKILEMWSDCLAYDWVLFCDLFGGAMKIPESVYYIPFDLATLFKVKGIDPDISREEYSGLAGGTKHNALWDSQVIRACYERAMSE